MWSLLFIISLICLIVGIVTCEEDILYPSIIFCSIFIVCILINIGVLVNGRTLDAKLEMYTQENATIEQSIDALAKDYYKHESDTYKSLKPENAVLFVSAYPDLQSNELAMKQIEIYINNNNKIRELKNDNINLARNRFWLYFGK